MDITYQLVLSETLAPHRSGYQRVFHPPEERDKAVGFVLRHTDEMQFASKAR